MFVGCENCHDCEEVFGRLCRELCSTLLRIAENCEDC